MNEITELLQRWSDGDSEALKKLIELVDPEVKKIAKSQMRKERPGHELQTTALVNETLMRLIDGKAINWRSRKQFYALVTTRMRYILLDFARQRRRRPRRVELEEDLMTYEKSQELLLLDEALTKLAQCEQRKAEIVELRYFGGYTVKEIAKLVDLGPATVERDLRFARAWLKEEMM